MVLRKGTVYSNAPGTTKRLLGFKASASTATHAGGTGGQGRAVNDSGQIVLGLYFSDGSSGVFVGP